MVGAADRDLAADQRDHAGTRDARPQRGVVDVADRHGQRVGGVVGPRRLGQPEQALDHVLHLALGRAARAADRALDLLRRVVHAGHRALAGGEQHDAAGLADRERGTHVLAEVERLEGHRRGRVLAQQVVQAGVDRGQAVGRRVARRGVDDAAVERDQAPAALRDDAVAGRGQAGVDAEDDHCRGILRTAPDAFAWRHGKAVATQGDARRPMGDLRGTYRPR